jgi:hypothetical protein
VGNMYFPVCFTKPPKEMRNFPMGHVNFPVCLI